MIRVLFLCQKNDILSRIAETLAKKLAGDAFQTFSAGHEPSSAPVLAVSRMAQAGASPETHSPKSLGEFRGMAFDYVLWIGNESDKGYETAREYWPECGIWHADLPDPAAVPPVIFTKKLDEQIQFISTHVQLFLLSHHKHHRLALTV